MHTVIVNDVIHMCLICYSTTCILCHNVTYSTLKGNSTNFTPHTIFTGCSLDQFVSVLLHVVSEESNFI